MTRHMFCHPCDSNVAYKINLDGMKVCQNCGDASKAFHSRVSAKVAKRNELLTWLDAQ